MSKTISKTGWTFPWMAENAFWGTAAAAIPNPVGTSGNDVMRGTNRPDSFDGRAGNDTIYGNGGVDVIVGGTGNDKIYLGKGLDTVYFNSRLNAKTNVDKIMDFKAADDTLGLAHKIFKTIGSGPLQENAFHAGKSAHDADDRIIYDQATGSLYYDADGTGSAAKIKFAVLANNAAITHADFFNA